MVIAEDAFTIQESISLWHLPFDVLDLILQKITFVDYVHLIQTNTKLRNVLDNHHLYETVWKANFADVLEAYEWPYSNEQEMLVGRKELYATIGEVEQFLIKIRGMIHEFGKEYMTKPFFLPNQDPALELIAPEVRNAMNEVLEEAYVKYAIKSKYFVPLVYLSDKYWKGFCEATEKKQDKYNISLMCWSRKLLHIQNVNLAIKFFNKVSINETSNIEKCFLELSRFDFEFSDLAGTRVKKLRKMRSDVRRLLPIKKGVLGFDSENLFLGFLGRLGLKLLELLPLSRPPTGSEVFRSYSGINVLREYVGQPSEPRMYRLAIMAKVLQEEVFSKLRFRIGSLEYAFDVKVTQFQILLGKFRLRLKTDFSGVSVERSPWADPAMESIMSAHIDYGKATSLSQNVEFRKCELRDLELTDVPCFSTYSEKWEASLEFVVSLLDKSFFRPPHYFNGYLIDYIGAIEGVKESVSWIYRIYHELPYSRSHLGNITSQEGRIAFDEAIHAFAVVTVPRLTDFFSGHYLAYAHDDSRIGKVRANCDFLGPISPEKIQWLMRTEGFTTMGMHYFTELRFLDKEYRFSSVYT